MTRVTSSQKLEDRLQALLKVQRINRIVKIPDPSYCCLQKLVGAHAQLIRTAWVLWRSRGCFSSLEHGEVEGIVPGAEVFAVGEHNADAEYP